MSGSSAPLFPSELPLVLAGPILRRLERRRLAIWLVGTQRLSLALKLVFDDQGTPVEHDILLDESNCRTVAVGRHAYIHLVDVSLPFELPLDTTIEYDLSVHQSEDGPGVAQWASHLLYPGAGRPSFLLRGRVDDILFGSCRKPHSPARDGLARVDALLSDELAEPATRPSILMLCGDQVYCDDVAGPMLVAIHALIERLRLYGEHLEGAVVSSSEALYSHAASYYRREELLPAFKSNEALRERFFGGVEKPVFTTANAHNHLATLAETIAIYLLVWSPVPWRLIQTQMPALIVLDTRTHRWRNGRYLSRPSGLMDWEALSEFQQHLLDQPSALIVSPTPMFGVKLIETIQRVMSWAGHSLMVDAENWMAHRGAASVMPNIFRHSRTPGNYVILSGDVHYSFVYDIQLRHQEQGPRIWQITSSGLKNEFPRKLLDWLDRLNRWLYAPWSPLNWLTKRRDMEVVPRLPDRRRAGERLWNAAGVGQVFLNPLGQPIRILQHNADGSAPTSFEGELPSH